MLDHTIRLEVVEASTFKWPEGFSLHDYYGSAWGVRTPDDEQGHIKETVRLKIAKGIAERFRLVSFHDSQQTEMLPDGGAMVTFTVKGASEMIPWLMSWGAAVEVLEPQWLRDTFISNVEEVLGIYHKIDCKK